MLNILVACKEMRTPGGLRFAYADEQYILFDDSPHWGEASNNLLDEATSLGGDALFLDDDTTLTVGCLDHVFSYYDHADIFGLDLHTLSGERQVGARHYLSETGSLIDWVEPGPAYVAHCSTSAIYIKHRVLAAGVRFPIWPGIHFEDVALCFDAWMHGFQVLAIPGRVDHAIDGGVGATKGRDPLFWEKWRENFAAFRMWCETRDLGKVPVGVREL